MYPWPFDIAVVDRASASSSTALPTHDSRLAADDGTAYLDGWDNIRGTCRRRRSASAGAGPCCRPAPRRGFLRHRVSLAPQPPPPPSAREDAYRRSTFLEPRTKPSASRRRALAPGLTQIPERPLPPISTRALRRAVPRPRIAHLRSDCSRSRSAPVVPPAAGHTPSRHTASAISTNPPSSVSRAALRRLPASARVSAGERGRKREKSARSSPTPGK